MAADTAQKLKIREGATLLTVNAPSGFAQSLGSLPPGVKVAAAARAFDQVHWFVKDRAGMEKELPKILPLVTGDVICWIYYPKGSSKLQTDLTRDKGWEALLRHDMQWISLISFDETWSAFGMRQKTDTDRKKEAKPKVRAVLDYVDAATKTVRLPDDLSAALQQHPQERSVFEKLAFSNKKEYVEWIVTAKRAETRAQRVEGTVERLGKGWKNPANN